MQSTLSTYDLVAVVTFCLLFINWGRLCLYVLHKNDPGGKNDKNIWLILSAIALPFIMTMVAMLSASNAFSISTILVTVICGFVPLKTHRGKNYKGWFKYPFLGSTAFSGDFEYIVRGWSMKIFISGYKPDFISWYRHDGLRNSVSIIVSLSLTRMDTLTVDCYRQHIRLAKDGVKAAGDQAMNSLPNQEICLKNTMAALETFETNLLKALKLDPRLKLSVEITGLQILIRSAHSSSKKKHHQLWPQPKEA